MDEKPKITHKEMRKLITSILKIASEVKTKEFEEVKRNIIKEIKSSPSDVPLCDDNKDTLAHYSIKEDKIEIVRVIIEAYMDILGIDEEFFNWFCQENKDQQTSIELATQYGNIQIIKYLYEIMRKTSEAEFKLRDMRTNLFHYSAIYNQCFPIIFFYEKLQKFFKESLIIDLPNQNGITPLHYACIKGNKEVMDLLLDLGADINAEDNEGNTCLHYAVKSLNVRIIKKLLVYGADKTKKNKQGQLPVHMIESDLNVEVFQLLQIQNFWQKIFGTKVELKGIKGNRNNLMLLFLVFFFILAKFLYLFRIEFIFIGQMQTDFVPYVREIIQNSSEPIFKNYTVKTLFNECVGPSSNYCVLETSIFFLSLLSDVILLVIITKFILFNKGVEEKKISKRQTPSIADLFEKDKIVCVKCRRVIEPTTIHCIVCNACVKNFDHHCFWLNTCINQKNLWKFYTFLISVIVFLVFNFILAIIDILQTPKFTYQYHQVVFNNINLTDFLSSGGNKTALNSEFEKKAVLVLWPTLNFFLILVVIYVFTFMVVPIIKSIVDKNKREKGRITEFENTLLMQTKDLNSSYSSSLND